MDTNFLIDILLAGSIVFMLWSLVNLFKTRREYEKASKDHLQSLKDLEEAYRKAEKTYREETAETAKINLSFKGWEEDQKEWESQRKNAMIIIKNKEALLDAELAKQKEITKEMEKKLNA